MSLAQFPSFPRPTLPRSSPPISSPSQQMPPSTSASGPHHRACCENGRPILTDPHTGQTVCSCQYPGGLMSYPRTPAGIPPGLESVYNASAYAAAGYVALGTEGSAFYSPLGTGPFDLKESAEAWRTLAATQPGFPYDPMAVYPYGPGKNATRENTNTLKAWLYEHRKNPYPTKGEKIMLAIITKMTLTQVSTWFANARRRLKKENKMTWSPRNRSEDGSDDIDNPDDDDDCADSRNRGGAISPNDHHDLDITSSKPLSPILGSESNHHMGMNNNNRPFKERIIRVDEDEDDDDDDDDCDDDDRDEDNNDNIHGFRAHLHRHHHHHLIDDINRKVTGLTSRDHRDRSPLRRSFSDSEHESAATAAASDGVLSRIRIGSTPSLDAMERPMRPLSSSTRDNMSATADEHNEDRANSPKSSSTHSHPHRTNSPSSDDRSPPSPSSTATTLHKPQQSSSSSLQQQQKQQQQQPSQTSTPATTRPKIWSISDVINTTSSSSSTSLSTSLSASSSSLSSSLSSSVSPSSSILSPSSTLSLSSIPSSLSSPLSLNRHHPFLSHSVSSSSSASTPRPIPNPGFLFLPHAPAHWQAAAARFAGMGGAYPLSLAHTTLSYPYNLATPNAMRAGLEAHAQSVAQLARATAEGNAATVASAAAAAVAVAASRGESREGEKLSFGSLHRHPNGALLSPGRDIDGIRSHGIVQPRLVVDTGLQ